MPVNSEAGKAELSIDLSSYLIDQKALEIVPATLAKRYNLIPLFKIGGTLTVAMSDPSNIVAIDELRNITGLDINILKAPSSEITQVITQNYGLAGTLKEMIANTAKTKTNNMAQAAEEAPVIKMVNLMINQAIAEKASDIHLEPQEKNARIRFRVDGILHEEAELPLSLIPAVVSRIKIMSGMDIAESRIPQDGRFQMRTEDKIIDVRSSSYPFLLGEKIVMRILDKVTMLIGLEELGFSAADFKKFKEVIARPYGMILVTGPTGSGKTTTLYAALSALNSTEKNIMTVEDPIEYQLAGITQSQVNVKAGFTFGNALRSILRQDPDIILIGEIRDLETAHIAVQAALTGHLVFATLHTNDASSALTRLVDMGVEPFLVASSVMDIVAQRLVRKVCDKCGGKGCNVCRKSGYRGRAAVFEQLVMTDKISKLVTDKASSVEIKKAAIAAGMKTLMDDGMEKAKKGVTTEQEIMRVSTND